MNPIVYAIPVFFVLMAIELIVARTRGRALYHPADAINSVSLGTLSQLVGVFTRLIMFGIYALAYEHARLFNLPADSIALWIGALIVYDFFYYWHHRLGHEVNVLWAAHVVHHQSESFNLSTALRQTSTGFLFGWIFYLPMAIVGVPPLVFVVVALIDLLYQYWIHTEQIGSLGWFDRVFASPSNHRVHHGVNDLYVDRNYGGILILWDRLFGTFQDEQPDQPAIYGTRAPLRSWNPLWANLHTYADLWHDSRHTSRWRDKLKVWWSRPGWRPDDVRERFAKSEFRIEQVHRYAPEVSLATTIYGAMQFLLAVAGGTHFLAVVDRLSMAQSLGYAAALVVTLWVVGGMLEGRAYYRWFEAVRIVALLAITAISGAWFGIQMTDVAIAVTLGAAITSLCALAFLHTKHPATHPPVTRS